MSYIIILQTQHPNYNGGVIQLYKGKDNMLPMLVEQYLTGALFID